MGDEKKVRGVAVKIERLTKENEGLKTALSGVTLKAITDIAKLVEVRDKFKDENEKLIRLNRECAKSNEGYNKSINEIVSQNLKLYNEKEELNRRRDADTKLIIRLTGDNDNLRKQIEGISENEAKDIADRASYHITQFITDLETGIKELSVACESEEERMGYNQAIRDVLALVEKAKEMEK